MPEKSFVEYAYEVMSAIKEPVSFKELFDKTLEASGLKLSQNETKVKMAKLYTTLLVDSRFVDVDGKWDLSERHTFSQNHKNYDEFDDEEDETDLEEEQLLREELGEEEEEDYEQESDDIDFDKRQSDVDEEEL